MNEVRQRKQVDKQKFSGDQEENKKLQNLKVQKKSNRISHFILFLLIIAAFITRLWTLNYPDEVVFDEVHFGKFASYYLQGKYYFDVHPPLGKLLVALSGYLKDYHGHYLFEKIGEVYAENNVPYVFMRAFCALFGIVLVPLVFKILQETGHSIQASTLGACMVLLDNALTTQTRFILLDSFLIFFDVFSVLCWIRFYKNRYNPFTFSWWFWLSVTGVSLSLTTSVKLVGLLLVAQIGIATIIDLWELIDVRKGLSHVQCIKHFMARAFSLIVIPIAVYLLWFYIHFKILKNTGPGDTFMTPAFQSSLAGSRFNRDSKAVFYNATVNLIHYKTNVYLHSHVQKYPLRYDDGRVSSANQQVTGYSHADSNNDFIILPADNSIPADQARIVKNGDIIQLFHVNTKCFLLTHDVASPLTPTHQEVTCVDLNLPDFAKRRNETLFEVQFIHTNSKDQILGTIDTKVRLIHVPTRVAINCHKGKLPSWGFEQLEVNGNKNPREETTSWIFDLVNDKYNIVQRKSIGSTGPSFLAKFFELQGVMLRENSALTSSHPFQSYPGSWPVLSRGISFWIKDSDRQVYLIGNPIIWWLGFFSVALLASLIIIDQIAVRRGIDQLEPDQRSKLITTGGFFLIGYLLHYLPFFIMGRALFLHHYLPALIFSFLTTANVFDFSLRLESTRTKNIVLFLLLSVFAVVFIYFAPFTYATPLTKDEINQRKWLLSWDFSFGDK